MKKKLKLSMPILIQKSCKSDNLLILCPASAQRMVIAFYSFIQNHGIWANPSALGDDAFAVLGG